MFSDTLIGAAPLPGFTRMSSSPSVPMMITRPSGNRVTPAAAETVTERVTVVESPSLSVITRVRV